MAVELIGKIKPKNNASFKLVDAIDIEWDGASIPLDGIADATTSSKGVVQVGSNITVDSGTISVSKSNVEAAVGYEVAKATDVAALQEQFANGKAKAAEEADKLSTPRSITLSGDISGTVNFDGSSNVEIATSFNDLDASKITSGTIDIARLPKAALDILVNVANEAGMLALTIDDVQKGDTVKLADTGALYLVVDDSKLGSMDAFMEYSAGHAASVDWSAIENKPAEFTPAAHTHTAEDVTAMTGYTGTLFNTTDSLNTALKKIEQSISDAGAAYVLPIATSETIGGVKIGDNITITSGAINLTKANVVGALGYTPPTQDTTYEVATKTAPGLLSASDKSKLDDLANYTLPMADADNLGGVKIGKNVSIDATGAISVADPADLTPYAKKADALTGDLTGTVAAPSIATGAVTTDKLADAAVTTIKLENGAVTDAKIATNSLSTSKLFIPTGDTLILDGGSAML
jgi:hypothetical protein